MNPAGGTADAMISWSFVMSRTATVSTDSEEIDLHPVNALAT